MLPLDIGSLVDVSDPRLSPDGATVAVVVTTLDLVANAYRSAALTKPGLYSLATGTDTIPVAVNPPADEADVRTLDSAAIRKSLGDIDVALEADQLPAVSVAGADHAGDDFGWSFMLIVLALVGVECFMAMRFGHYRRT